MSAAVHNCVIKACVIHKCCDIDININMLFQKIKANTEIKIILETETKL